MFTVLLVIHTIVVLFLIGIILIQKPDGDGLSGLGGGSGSIMSGRAAGNMLTRITAILATFFIASSLLLAIMSGHTGKSSLADKVLEQPAEEQPEAPAKSKDESSVPKPE